MRKKHGFLLLFIVMIFISAFVFTSCTHRPDDQARMTDGERQIQYYTCGMHPSVKVSMKEYNKGNVSCPICNMNLTPVYMEEQIKETEGLKGSKGSHGRDKLGGKEQYYGCGMEGAEHVFLIKELEGVTTCPICGMELIELSKEEADRLKGVVSKVKIKGEEARLAGVQTEAAKKLHLYKEIRTVGNVAYDPELAIAQEEFIASLRVFDKIQEGKIKEISERALNLVNSSKRRLRLLGLGEEQIDKLEKERKVQTSLILPEEKMWIYGDVYEYEMGWVKLGSKVKVTTSSFSGDAFYGVITSINPVLDPKTRSLRFRAEVDNADLKLRPEMYVDVIIMSMYKGKNGEREVLAIPKDAVLDTGVRKIVWISKGHQEYEGRVIDIGPEATGLVNGQEFKFYPVLNGLKVGEDIVTKANFLIDSQSQISGVAAAAYGGAVGVDEKKGSAGHRH